MQRGRSLAEGAEQAHGLSPLPRREGGDGAPYRARVGGKDPPHETPPRGGESEQHHPTVAPRRPAAHQAALHELVHHIGGAGRLDQDAALHLAYRQAALVVQHFQHPELRRAQAEACDTGP